MFVVVPHLFSFLFPLLLPDIPEAHHIYNYAQSVDMTDMDFVNGEQDTAAYSKFAFRS